MNSYLLTDSLIFLQAVVGSFVFIGVALTIIIVLEYKYHYLHSVTEKLKELLAEYSISMFNAEGFVNGNMNEVYEPNGIAENSVYSPGDAFSKSNEKLLSDFIPTQSENEAQSVWAKIPSQTCLKYDDGEKLKPLANYYQRTNNYMRTHPDDCSAPFHEMVGTFYKPTDGVGKTAPSGLSLPGSVVSCTGTKNEVVGNSSVFTQSLSD